MSFKYLLNTVQPTTPKSFTGAQNRPAFTARNSPSVTSLGE